MSLSPRHAVTALAVVAALAPATAHADAPPSTCGTITLEWSSGNGVAVDTAFSTADTLIHAASCGIVATPITGTGAATVTLPDGAVCSLALTTQAYHGVAYNLDHAFSSYVGVRAETRCTSKVDSVAQRVDAIVGGVVTGSTAGPTATGADFAQMTAAFYGNTVGKRAARYCVDVTTGADVTPACATSTPV